MGRFRIEVDPDVQSAPTVELAASVKRLLAAERGDDPATTVAAAAETERAAHAATDKALLDADGTVPRRAMATALGRAHDAVNRRLKRIKTQQQEEDSTVSKKDANREHRDAKDELARISKRDGDVTDAVEAAQQRVVAAEKHVSWWRR